MGTIRCQNGPKTLELVHVLVNIISFQRDTINLCRLKACKTGGLDQILDFRWAACHYVKSQKMWPQNIWLSAVLQPYNIQRHIKHLFGQVWYILTDMQKLKGVVGVLGPLFGTYVVYIVSVTIFFKGCENCLKRPSTEGFHLEILYIWKHYNQVHTSSWAFLPREGLKSLKPDINIWMDGVVSRAPTLSFAEQILTALKSGFVSRALPKKSPTKYRWI